MPLPINRFTANKRVKLQNLLRDYRALGILAKRITAEEREIFDKQIASVGSIPMRSVVKGLDFYRDGLETLKNQVRPVATLSAIRQLVEDSDVQLPMTMMVPKVVLESDWIANLNFDDRFDIWPHLPPHARISIDIHASRSDHNTRLDWRLLEASLFEDMAMLWNEMITAPPKNESALPLLDARIPWKRIDVINRSILRAAFALLEGYLNGIALDIRCTRDDLTADEKETLSEGLETGKFTPLSLRDKVLKYQRIALKAKHAPVQESNCEELNSVLGAVREVRDSLIHPTARWDDTRKLQREYVFYEVPVNRVEELVDAVVGSIRRIDGALSGLFGSVSIWLHNRNDNNRYPNEVFH